MFKPTHLAHIRTRDGMRSVALQRTYASESLEVFRDCEDAEFHQDSLIGVTQWTEYEIRALGPDECLSPCTWQPAGPPAHVPYRPAGLRSYVSEPSMLSC